MHQINEVIQIKRYEEYENIDDFIIESRRFIGERITNLRMENGISEYKLSKSIGKNDGYIQKISSGKSLPSMEAFIDICAYFKISPEEFFMGPEEEIAEDSRFNNSDIDFVKKLKYLDEDEICVLKQLVKQFLKYKS